MKGLWLPPKYGGNPTVNYEEQVVLNREAILGSLPATIEDAITVTRALGYHFLWVDKYCISQDAETRHSQICQVDIIYENGDDPTYGLPGVGCLPRRKGERTWVVANNDPLEDIVVAKWMRRAWTYQEALLSRRLLFFTSSEMYFECRGCCRSEAIDTKIRIEFELNSMELTTLQEYRLRFPGIGGNDLSPFTHLSASRCEIICSITRGGDASRLLTKSHSTLITKREKRLLRDPSKNNWCLEN